MQMQTKHPLAAWRETQDPPLSQEDVAGSLEVSRWTVNRIETGSRKPSPELAMKIAAFTGQKVPVAAMRPDLAAVFGPSDRSAA